MGVFGASDFSTEGDAMGQAAKVWHLRRFPRQPTRCSMSQRTTHKSVTALERHNHGDRSNRDEPVELA